MNKKTTLYIGFALSALCLTHVHAADKPLVVASAFPVETPMPLQNAASEFRATEPMHHAVIRDVTKGPNGLSYFLSENVPVSITLYTMGGETVNTYDLKAGAHGASAGTNHFLFPKVAPGTYMAEIAVDSSRGVYTVTERITLP